MFSAIAIDADAIARAIAYAHSLFVAVKYDWQAFTLPSSLLFTSIWANFSFAPP